MHYIYKANACHCFIQIVQSTIMKKILFCLFILPVLAQAQQKFEEITLTDNVKKIKVNNQITLGYSTASGV